MGKIRITTLGDTDTEKALKQKAQARRETKKEKKMAKLQGKGGGRVTDMAVEEIITTETILKDVAKVKTGKKAKVKTRSPKYKDAARLVDKEKLYSIEEAIKLVKKTSYSKFIGSIEVHINTKEKGLRGTVSLPHGTGKKIRVAIADEAVIEKVQSGKIDFDILVAHPQIMPKLAKVARILGPKGLMPNPKAGTISTKPEEVVKKLSAGQIQWKTEGEAPIVHTIIGKVDFDEKKLLENLTTLIKAVNPFKINSLFIKASMGPAIKVLIDKE